MVFAPSVEEAQWLIGRPKLIEIWEINIFLKFSLGHPNMMVCGCQEFFYYEMLQK